MTNQNKNASINTQIYESVGPLVFNYFLENIEKKNECENLKDIHKKYIFVKQLILNTNNIENYYFTNNGLSKSKCIKMLEYIYNNDNKIITGKIKTSIVVLNKLLDEHKKNPIKRVLWDGEGGNEKTSDIIIKYENNSQTMISLKEGKSFYYVNTTLKNILNRDFDIKNFNPNIVYKRFDETIKIYKMLENMTENDLKLIRKLIDYNGRPIRNRNNIKNKRNIQEKIYKSKNNLKLYYERINIEKEFIKENIKHIFIDSFLKNRLINPNKNVEIWNIKIVKNKREKRTLQILDNSIFNYIDNNLDNINDWEYKETTTRNNFEIVIKYNNDDEIILNCSIRSDKSKKNGKNLAQYNYKFNICKIILNKKVDEDVKNNTQEVKDIQVDKDIEDIEEKINYHIMKVIQLKKILKEKFKEKGIKGYSKYKLKKKIIEKIEEM